MRAIVIDRLPVALDSRLVAYIEEANISQYINRFVPESLGEEAKKKFKGLKSELFSLFERRNKLMHLGSNEGIDKSSCNRFISVTKKLTSLQVDA